MRHVDIILVSMPHIASIMSYSWSACAKIFMGTTRGWNTAFLTCIIEGPVKLRITVLVYLLGLGTFQKSLPVSALRMYKNALKFFYPLNAEVYQVEEEIYRRNYPRNLLLSLNPEVVSYPTHFEDDVAEVEEDDIMDDSIGKNTPVQGKIFFLVIWYFVFFNSWIWISST